MEQTQSLEITLPKVIAGLGHSDFFMLLLHYLNLSCQIDHLAVFIFDHKLVPQQIDAKGVRSDHLARKA